MSFNSQKFSDKADSFNLDDLTDQPNMLEKIPLEFPKNFVPEIKPKSGSPQVSINRFVGVEQEYLEEDVLKEKSPKNVKENPFTRTRQKLKLLNRLGGPKKSPNKTEDEEEKKEKPMIKRQSKVLKRRKSGTISLATMFNILRNLKKRAYYHSITNLRDFHYKMINDKASHFIDEESSSKKVKNKWAIKALVSEDDDVNALDLFHQHGKKIMKKIGNTNVFRSVTYVMSVMNKKISLFYPNHIWKMIWDFFIACSILIQFISYTIENCFEINFNDNDNFHQLIGFMRIFFYLDIFVSLNTIYYENGKPVLLRGKVMIYYIKKYFLLDLLSCVGITAYEYQDGNILFSKLQVLVFPKLFRFREISEKLDEMITINDRLQTVYNLFGLIVKLMISAHLLACFWHYLGIYELTNLPDTNNWLIENKISDNSLVTRYIYSIYWSITTMLTVGYGDITPTNEREIVFTICSMFVGCGIFGYSMNSIADIIKLSGRKQKNLRENLIMVHTMLRKKKINEDLTNRVKKYLEFVWIQEEEEDAEKENYVMGKLSSSLRDEIFLETNVKFLKMIPALSKHFEEDTLIKLARAMRKVRFSPEEYIIHAGEKEDSNSIYFVLDGELELITERGDSDHDNNIVWKDIKKNDYFGVEEFFSEKKSPYSVIAKDFSTLFQIPLTELMNIIKKKPSEYEKFCKLKDMLILYSQNHSLEVKCTSCERFDHQIYRCSFYSYIPERKFVISKYKYQQKLRLKRFKRKGTKKSYMSLMDRKFINTNLEEFLDTYKDDPDLGHLIQLYTIPEEVPAVLDRKSSMDVFEEESSNNNSTPPPQIRKIQEESPDSNEKIEKPAGGNINNETKKKISMFARQVSKLHNNKGKKPTFLESESKPQESIKPEVVQPKHQTEDQKSTWAENFDKMNSFKYYFPNNNPENVIMKINLKILKRRKTFNFLMSK